jgi:hypothetical protein
MSHIFSRILYEIKAIVTINSLEFILSESKDRTLVRSVILFSIFQIQTETYALTIVPFTMYLVP